MKQRIVSQPLQTQVEKCTVLVTEEPEYGNQAELVFIC